MVIRMQKMKGEYEQLLKQRISTRSVIYTIQDLNQLYCRFLYVKNKYISVPSICNFFIKINLYKGQRSAQKLKIISRIDVSSKVAYVHRNKINKCLSIIDALLLNGIEISEFTLAGCN